MKFGGSLLLACILLGMWPAASEAGLKHTGAQMHPWGLGSGRDPAENINELDALRSAGADTVRMDMPWADIEPFRDRIDAGFQRRTDEFIAAANARGIEPVMTVMATPCWASTDPSKGRCARYSDRFRGSEYAPADAAELGEISAYLARRYTSSGFALAALEIWNEPNWCSLKLADDRPGCPPRPLSDATSSRKAAVYASMVRRTYPRVKEVAPSLPVLAGALGDYRPIPFLRALYRNGIDGHYDAISIHPYNRRWSPAGNGREDGRPRGQVFGRYVEEAHRTMAANEASLFTKPLWLTEFGWTTCALGDPRYSGYCVSEENQGNFIDQAFRKVATWPFVEAALVYEVRDSAVGDPMQARFGLLRGDFSAKPAFEAAIRAFQSPERELVAPVFGL